MQSHKPPAWSERTKTYNKKTSWWQSQFTKNQSNLNIKKSKVSLKW